MMLKAGQKQYLQRYQFLSQKFQTLFELMAKPLIYDNNNIKLDVDDQLHTIKYADILLALVLNMKVDGAYVDAQIEVKRAFSDYPEPRVEHLFNLTLDNNGWLSFEDDKEATKFMVDEDYIGWFVVTLLNKVIRGDYGKGA